MIDLVTIGIIILGTSNNASKGWVSLKVGPINHTNRSATSLRKILRLRVGALTAATTIFFTCFMIPITSSGNNRILLETFKTSHYLAARDY